MEVTIHARNMDMTDWLQQYVEKKVKRLERYFPQARELRVDLVHNETRAASDRYTAQLTMWANGQILRAEESTGDIFASIDAAVDIMYRQIERYKGRRYKNKRRNAAANAALMEAMPAVLEEEEAVEEERPRIVRVKEFVAEPMDPEEAIEQMELLGHDFYVFFNPETKSLNVIYRRRDGNYGLLQPQIVF